MTVSALRSQPRPALPALRSTPASLTVDGFSPRAMERPTQDGLARMGRVDATLLTRLGSLHAPVSRPAVARDTAPATPIVHGTRPEARIEDNKTVTSTLDVPENVTVDALGLDLDIAHSYRGDLVVKLTSPSGKSAVVSERAGGSADNLQGRFDLSAFAGEPAAGKWTLTVQDTASADQGTLKAWGLNITPRGTPPPPPPPGGEDPFKDLRDTALLRAIKDTSKDAKVRSYNEARRIIFSELDVKNGQVACVYTGREIAGGKIPNSSDMNVEHTWPQSKGATGAAKSDLHHLFPTDSRSNSTRSSHPFGKVENVKWSHPSGAKLGTDAQGRTVFEPPDAHKGNVARAMFYFSATYSKPIPDFEEAVLKQWNHLDAVDAAEIERNRRIATLQGNRNQFVEHSALADRVRDF